MYLSGGKLFQAECTPNVQALKWKHSCHVLGIVKSSMAVVEHAGGSEENEMREVSEKQTLVVLNLSVNFLIPLPSKRGG